MTRAKNRSKTEEIEEKRKNTVPIRTHFGSLNIFHIIEDFANFCIYCMNFALWFLQGWPTQIYLQGTFVKIDEIFNFFQLFITKI
jgi:hypothetical protein